MATIVAATVPLDQFVLGETLATVPEAEVEFVRAIACQTDRTSLVWGRAEQPERLSEEFDADTTTAGVERLARFDGARLYEVEWQPSSRIRLLALLSSDGTVLDACGTSGGWSLRCLFPDHADVSVVRDVCAEHGIDLQIHTVCRLDEPSAGSGFDLTDGQYNAITTAFAAGYYDVPRRTTLQELSDSFEVSHQALSERIRRGHGALVANALLTSARTSAVGL